VSDRSATDAFTEMRAMLTPDHLNAWENHLIVLEMKLRHADPGQRWANQRWTLQQELDRGRRYLNVLKQMANILGWQVIEREG
jgi:hypothetical protein